MKIHVFGLGAIGSNLLVQLARQFPDFEFVGVDFDKVEDRNLATQQYFQEHVGLYKADAMRIVLQRYIRKPKYYPNKLKVTNTTPISSNFEDQLLVDCFDNTESRKLLRLFDSVTQSYDLNILHIGFSPQFTAEAIWNKNYSVPNDVDTKAVDICTQQDALSFIQFVVSLTTLTISEWIQTKEKKDFIVTGKHRVRWI